MKKLVKLHIFSWFFTLFLVIFSSCTTPANHARSIEKTLHRQQHKAMVLTGQLRNQLMGSTSMDSIWLLSRTDDQILFYIFDQQRLLYWSDNWLAADNVFLQQYDTWWYGRCDNAHVVGIWTAAGAYNILTIIPIKYAYPFSNHQLHNDFIAPFHGKEQIQLSRSRGEDHYPVLSSDGKFLFSICPTVRERPVDPAMAAPLAQSFSYQQLLSGDSDDNFSLRSHSRVRVYFILMLTLFLVLIAWGVIVLIRNHGFRDLRLRAKFLYLFITLIVVFFAYVFLMSVRYVRSNYEQRQKTLLQQKCSYVQSSLQALYFWDISLSSANSAGLNIDLRDLCFTYEADIHVYDLQGNLIGSSTPVLFDRGLISRHISPEPFFTSQHTLVQYEQIGDMRYLCAYAPFYNGSMVPVGFVAVPSFISTDEMHSEVDQYVARLLPPYILVLLLAIFISYAIARGLTYPISSLSESLRHFHLGNRNNHIEYSHNDEVGELVLRYNQMVDQLEESTSLLTRSERESAWRTMARQIAHEINNPLTPMRLRVQQLQRLHQDADPRFDSYFRETAKLLVQQIDDLSRIASSFSSFAKMPEVHVSNVDLAQKLSSVIYLFQTNQENIPVRYVGPDSGVMAQADAEQISEVFTNIIKNALQALAGRIDGDIIVILKDINDRIQISISDNGPGIPEEFRERIFLPNFTTKSTGTGLGLAISKNIVEGSGGEIKFDTSEKGTTFYIYLKK